MNAHTDFSITRLSPAPAGASHAFALVGVMDAHCAAALMALPALERGSKVILDFAEVAHVNSMGLAQLLRLLDVWHGNGVKIEVAHVNRMTNMLFKMTGLNRYFEAAPATAAPRPNTATLGGGGIRPSAAASPLPARPPAPAASEPPHLDRLTFQACAQSINQMSGWYFCNNYLQRKLARNIRIQVAPPANSFDIHAHEAHLMFVKPFEACHLLRNRGYQALARPADEADEVVVVVRTADSRRHWREFGGGRVVTAIANSFVYLLGLYLCEESGLDSAGLTREFAGNDIKALMLLLRGQADLLFMAHKTYRELSELSRRETRVLDASQTRFAYPMFCASPQISTIHDGLRDTLTGMADNPAGADVLKELSVQHWVPLAKAEIDMLGLLYDRYAPAAQSVAA